MGRWSCTILLFMALLLLLSVSDSFGKKKVQDDNQNVQLATKSVLSRKLVTAKPTSSSILKEHQKYYEDGRTTKNFQNPTLGYVTPWNNHGYDIAKIFNKKFTYISPVWYTIQLKQIAGGELTLELGGKHDVDLGWLNDVRNSNNNTEAFPKIVPRFLLQNWGETHYSVFVSHPSLVTQFTSLIVDECKRVRHDGIVLDTSYLGLRMKEKSEEPALLEVFKQLSSELHKNSLVFILVEPPTGALTQSDGHQKFDSHDFEKIVNLVDHISLMTYDYSMRGIGPNSPKSWVAHSVMSLLSPEMRTNKEITQKILTGIPFYGYDFVQDSGSREAIVASKYLELLKTHQPELLWEETSHESLFTYPSPSGEHVVYYPTLKFVNERLKLAEELGVGISIWETGQGLDYWYDLL